jgi:hypothetical protein
MVDFVGNNLDQHVRVAVDKVIRVERIQAEVAYTELTYS